MRSVAIFRSYSRLTSFACHAWWFGAILWYSGIPLKNTLQNENLKLSHVSCQDQKKTITCNKLSVLDFVARCVFSIQFQDLVVKWHSFCTIISSSLFEATNIGHVHRRTKVSIPDEDLRSPLWWAAWQLVSKQKPTLCPLTSCRWNPEAMICVLTDVIRCTYKLGCQLLTFELFGSWAQAKAPWAGEVAVETSYLERTVEPLLLSLSHQLPMRCRPESNWSVGRFPTHDLDRSLPQHMRFGWWKKPNWCHLRIQRRLSCPQFYHHSVPQLTVPSFAAQFLFRREGVLSNFDSQELSHAEVPVRWRNIEGEAGHRKASRIGR